MSRLRTRSLGLSLAAALWAMGCASCHPAPPAEEPAGPAATSGGGPSEGSAMDEAGRDAAPEETIGVATMEPDGTLVLQLRATGPGGAVGDALLRYPPDHERYQQILDHVGPIRPGESRPVRPFPED